MSCLRQNLWLRLFAVVLCVSVDASAVASPVTFICEYDKYADETGIHATKDFKLTFIIDSVADKAYILGNNGSASVTMVSSSGGVTLIEITDAGNVQVTAIDKRGMSVHSRSTILFGEILPTQYYGECERK